MDKRFIMYSIWPVKTGSRQYLKRSFHICQLSSEKHLRFFLTLLNLEMQFLLLFLNCGVQTVSGLMDHLFHFSLSETVIILKENNLPVGDTTECEDVHLAEKQRSSAWRSLRCNIIYERHKLLLQLVTDSLDCNWGTYLLGSKRTPFVMVAWRGFKYKILTS